MSLLRRQERSKPSLASEYCPSLLLVSAWKRPHVAGDAVGATERPCYTGAGCRRRGVVRQQGEQRRQARRRANEVSAPPQRTVTIPFWSSPTSIQTRREA